MKATLLLFGAGSALLFPFEYTLTLLGGVLLLLAAIVVGVFSVASPEFLERDE